MLAMSKGTLNASRIQPAVGLSSQWGRFASQKPVVHRDLPELPADCEKLQWLIAQVSLGCSRNSWGKVSRLSYLAFQGLLGPAVSWHNEDEIHPWFPLNHPSCDWHEPIMCWGNNPKDRECSGLLEFPSKSGWAGRYVERVMERRKERWVRSHRSCHGVTVPKIRSASSKILRLIDSQQDINRPALNKSTRGFLDSHSCNQGRGGLASFWSHQPLVEVQWTHSKLRVTVRDHSYGAVPRRLCQGTPPERCLLLFANLVDYFQDTQWQGALARVDRVFTH